MDLSIYGSPEDFAWGLANDPNFVELAASYGITLNDMLSYISGGQPTPEPTSAPVSTPAPTSAPVSTQEPTPTPAPTSAPVQGGGLLDTSPGFTDVNEPDYGYYEPVRTPYNGLSFQDIVNQTQIRANQGYTPTDLYNFGVYSLGLTADEAQAILGNITFATPAPTPARSSTSTCPTLGIPRTPLMSALR